MDIRSAFPSVPHDALFKTCENYGFDTASVGLIKSIYSNISQRVFLKNKESRDIDINNGIMQGTNFAQTFFIMYINELLNASDRLKSYLFADDFQAYIEINSDEINAGIDTVNQEQNKINDLITRHELKLNVEKSGAMIIGTKNRINKIDFGALNNVKVGANKLKYRESIKNLGVVFDDTMSFEQHNCEKIGRMYGALNRVNHVRKFLPENIKRDISCAIIDPIISYGNVISFGWGAHGTNGTEARIKVADNDKIRFVYNLKRDAHISEYRERMHALTPEERARFDSFVMIRKGLLGNLPAYLNTMFETRESITRNSGNLNVRKPRSAFDKRMFTYAANDGYNKIPREIKNITSIAKFKRELKKFMIDNRNNN